MSKVCSFVVGALCGAAQRRWCRRERASAKRVSMPANFHPLDAYHHLNYAGQPPTLSTAQIDALEHICYGITSP